MLILTRRVGESIIIGDNAEITIAVVSIKGHQVKLAIDAPREISVHREEIYQRIRYQRIQAEKRGDDDEGEGNE